MVSNGKSLQLGTSWTNWLPPSGERMKIAPSDLCSDTDFLRRIYLDLVGLPPTADQVRAFMADPQESQVKRQAIIDQLLASDEYVDHWTNKWSDLLQVEQQVPR